MRTLTELYHGPADVRRFVEDYVSTPHGGNWALAKDHWTRTVRYIADRAKELEDMTAEEAGRHAEELARTLCLGLLRTGTCWACAQDPPPSGTPVVP
jgi:hypothetical protein